MQGHIFIQEAPKGLDVDELRSHLQTDGCGAIVSFIGITRGFDEGEEVLRLEFDAWQERLSETLNGLAEDAVAKFGLHSVAMGHRTGSVGPGEGGTTVQNITAPLQVPLPGAHQAPGKRHLRGNSIDHGGIDHLALS